MKFTKNKKQYLLLISNIFIIIALVVMLIPTGLSKRLGPTPEGTMSYFALSYFASILLTFGLGLIFSSLTAIFTTIWLIVSIRTMLIDKKLEESHDYVYFLGIFNMITSLIAIFWVDAGTRISAWISLCIIIATFLQYYAFKKEPQQ